ncbi:ribonuclease HII [Clostridia bacterium]|nr:ribonuclease HII [Clostridia bacterium]
MIVCGVDEAGRGPLAGPVYAAAVILPPHLEIPGLRDSKKLSEGRREKLFPLIKRLARGWAVASASAEEIDSLNIREASMLAMNRAVAALEPRPDLALIDGDYANGFGMEARTIVHGDDLEPCISAASILAKVSRDTYMRELARQYPEYGFELHKGYGTKFHVERLRKYGSCPEHRALFIRKFV